MDWLALPIADSYGDFLEEKLELSFEQVGADAAIFPEYKWDPVGFMVEVLGVDPWRCQREIAELLVDHTRVSVAACYASGKTFLAACLVLWWLYTREDCLCVTTAPTGRQVKELLWAEISTVHAMSLQALGGKILTRETRITKRRRGFGVAGDGKSSGNAGYHARSGCVLFIVDEASGMTREVLDDFEGLLTDEMECRELKIGNPTSTSGPFFDEHTKAKYAAIIKLYSISALLTPNLTGEGEDKKRYPGLVSASWVETRRKKWGESHPFWISKVLGKFFIVEGLQKVVPEEWIELAKLRWAEHLEDDGTVDKLSADVAAQGQNLTVLRRLKGRRLTKVAAWSGAETQAGEDDSGKKGTMLTALRIVEWAEKLGSKQLYVDSQGLGIGIADRIQEYKDQGRLPNCEFYPVAMGDGAQDSKNYFRVVDEVQFAMRRAFDPDNPNAVAIDPGDTQLAEELPLRSFQIMGDGEDSSKIKVSRKRDLIKDGHDSPDDADAASLLFYEPPGAEGEFFFL